MQGRRHRRAATSDTSALRRSIPYRHQSRVRDLGTVSQSFGGGGPDGRKATRGCRSRHRPRPHARGTGRGVCCAGIRHSVREAVGYVGRTLPSDRGGREESGHHLRARTWCAASMFTATRAPLTMLHPLIAPRQFCDIRHIPAL